jgi:hypothetical protein
MGEPVPLIVMLAGQLTPRIVSQWQDYFGCGCACACIMRPIACLRWLRLKPHLWEAVDEVCIARPNPRVCDVDRVLGLSLGCDRGRTA